VRSADTPPAYRPRAAGCATPVPSPASTPGTRGRRTPVRKVRKDDSWRTDLGGTPRAAKPDNPPTAWRASNFADLQETWFKISLPAFQGDSVAFWRRQSAPSGESTPHPMDWVMGVTQSGASTPIPSAVSDFNGPGNGAAAQVSSRSSSRKASVDNGVRRLSETPRKSAVCEFMEAVDRHSARGSTGGASTPGARSYQGMTMAERVRQQQAKVSQCLAEVPGPPQEWHQRQKLHTARGDGRQLTDGCHSSSAASSAEPRPLIAEVSSDGVSSSSPGTSQQEFIKSSPNAGSGSRGSCDPPVAALQNSDADAAGDTSGSTTLGALDGSDSGTTDQVPPVPSTRVIATLGHIRSHGPQDGTQQEGTLHFDLAAEDWAEDEDEYFPVTSLG